MKTLVPYHYVHNTRSFYNTDIISTLNLELKDYFTEVLCICCVCVHNTELLFSFLTLFVIVYTCAGICK